LPVVSVMRETESQLLPDVGAIVTCKVSRWFPSVGVRCSALRPTLKSSGKWPEYSLNSYRP
ncbi:exosome complex component CSL4 isoform c, partial [Daubentonia madagascariensis]